MSKQFPHINENMNDFPKNNERVYAQYDNNFDYSNYIGHYTIFKPCNVRWSANDANRVWWDSNAERDAWFDRIRTPFYSQDFRSGMNIVDGEPIKLPIPYQAIQQFNYLMVIVPDTPVDNNINSVKRFYYHIINSVYAAPSVSLVTLELDSFTTYQHSVEIPRIELERGHYPMKLTSVETYLQNPMSNNNGLLTPEPNAPNVSDIVQQSEFHSVGNDELMVCFAMRASITDMQAWQPADPTTGNSTPPTYGDAPEYYGKQYNVADYRWASQGDYSNVSTPTSPGLSMGNNRPNGYTVVGALSTAILNPTGTNNILKYMEEYYPQFYTTVAAIFVVPRALVNVDGTRSLTFGTYKLYALTGVTDKITDITLDSAMFHYPTEYENIAKLYTTPYEAIKFIDTTTNNTAVFHIQDMSDNVTIERRCQLAYPYLNAQMFLQGIGSNKTINYQWKAMNNANRSTAIPESGYNFIFNYDIPTFELMVDSAVLYYLNNYNAAIRIQREQALNAYHNAIRNGNTGVFNTGQTIATALTNGTNSATTARDNAINSANTANTNVNASASTLIANNTIRTNLNSTLNTNNNTLLTTQVTSDLSYKEVVKKQSNDMILTKYLNSNTVTQNMIDEDFNAAAFSALAGGAVVVGGVALAGVTAGVSAGLAATTAGAVAAETAGVASMGMQVMSFAGQQASGMIGGVKNQAQANIVKSSNEYIGEATRTMNDTVFQTLSDNTFYVLDETRDCNTDNTNATNTAVTNINNNNAALMRANSQRSTNTSNSNATNTYNTTTSNLTRTNTTEAGNNNRNQLTLIDDAQRALELKQRINDWTKADLARTKAATITNASGNAVYDLYGSNGIIMQIVTQPKDIIKRCGDEFLKYGYMYHQNVENPTLITNEYFSYWQGDALVYSIDAPHHAVEAIRTLFAEGLTVWTSGDIIGHSIYDNPVK